MSTPALPQDVLDALLTATTALATALVDAQEVAPPIPFTVGDTVTPEQARNLPVGTRFRDRENDIWVRRADGFGWPYTDYTTAMRPEDYTPLVLESLPAPEPEKPVIKVGDRVRVVRDFYPQRTEFLGKTGVVTAVNESDGLTRTVPYKLRMDADRCVWYMAEVEPVAPAEPEKPSDRVKIRTADNPRRIVNAEPSLHGGGGAWLRVTDYGDGASAWLSREEARTLAATLTVIADS